MADLFEALDPTQKVLWALAIAASAIFLFQTVMTFMGSDAFDGAAPDAAGDSDGGDYPFQLFSLRNLINFILAFSWFALAFYDKIDSRWLLMLCAFVAGSSFVAFFFFAIKQILKLNEDNSFQINNCVGAVAEVYLRIPASKSGKGKVQLSSKGSVHEIDAITEGPELPTGTLAKVVSVENGNLLVVTSI